MSVDTNNKQRRMTERKSISGNEAHLRIFSSDDQDKYAHRRTSSGKRIYKKTAHTVDGIAWLVTCATSILGLADIYFSLNAMPLRHSENPGKAVVLLIFSPLIIFGFLVRFRQSMNAEKKARIWFRAALCIVTYALINF